MFTYYEKSEKKHVEYNSKLKQIPKNKRVYIDESGITTCLQREYAHAPRGEIVEDVKRGQQFARRNDIGALNNGTYSAVTCYHHTTNSDFFASWFKDVLLKEIPSGYTVILDNARFHRKERLRKLARANVRLLFLPPYSPDYNPIEKSWANMKRFIRNNLTDYETIDPAYLNYLYYKCLQTILPLSILHIFSLNHILKKNITKTLLIISSIIKQYCIFFLFMSIVFFKNSNQV